MISNYCLYNSALVKKDANATARLFVTAYHRPRFVCATVTYQEFRKAYVSQPKAMRVISNPNELVWTGILKTICLLACAFFYGCHELFFRDRREFKACLYSAGRAAQEGVGHFIGLFNDCLGAYLIQEAQLNKDCYKYILTPPPYSPPQAAKVEPVRVEPPAVQPQPLQVPTATPVVKRRGSILKIDQPPIPSGKKKSVSFATLRPSIKPSEAVPMSTLSSEEILQLSLEKVSRISVEEAQKIVKKLPQRQPRDHKFSLSNVKSISELTVAQFRMLSIQELEEIHRSLDPGLLTLLTSEQAKAVEKHSPNENIDVDLAEFREYSPDEQERDLSHYTATLDKIGKAEFFKWLQNADEQLLNTIKLSELDQKQFPKSKLRFALMKDEEFRKINIQEKEIQALPDSVFQYIVDRLSECLQEK